jgi:hypothetical protein
MTADDPYDMPPEETTRVQQLYIDWPRTQRLRDDPVGDIARLAERGRRRIGATYSFSDLYSAINRARQRHPHVSEAFMRSVSEHFAWVGRIVREHTH